MNARELFSLAPLGAYVRFSDGTPKPPDRFVKKRREWKAHNDAGYYVKTEPSNGKDEWSKDGFALQTLNDPALCVVVHYSVDTCALQFEYSRDAMSAALYYGKPSAGYAAYIGGNCDDVEGNGY